MLNRTKNLGIEEYRKNSTPFDKVCQKKLPGLLGNNFGTYPKD
jgi:hypothetical protein